MLKEQIEVLVRDNIILKRAVAIQHERQKENDEKNQEVQHLKQLLGQYQEQFRSLEVSFILFWCLCIGKLDENLYVKERGLCVVELVCTGKQLRLDTAFATCSAEQLHSWAFPSRCILINTSVSIATSFL